MTPSPIVTRTPTSSNVKAFAYDVLRSILIVFFKSGSVWEYENVPQSTHSDMQSAVSVGKFFFANIRNIFSGHEVVDSRYDSILDDQPLE